jgi:hypothetical protein
MQKRDITAKKVGFKPFNATNVHKYINKHRYINKHTLIVYVYIYICIFGNIYGIGMDWVEIDFQCVIIFGFIYVGILQLTELGI